MILKPGLITVGVFLWVLLRTMSNMSLAFGTVGISFHVSCMTKGEGDKIHPIAIFLWCSGGIADIWCMGVLIAMGKERWWRDAAISCFISSGLLVFICCFICFSIAILLHLYLSCLLLCTMTTPTRCSDTPSSSVTQTPYIPIFWPSWQTLPSLSSGRRETMGTLHHHGGHRP